MITGTVVLYGSKEQALGDTTTSLIDMGGKSGVFLELTNGTDYNRRVTDNRGNFSFTDIRPGKWTLKVIGGDIPEYHVVVPESTVIDAMPGEKKAITIELKPKLRTIKILQEGTVIQEGPAKAEQRVEPLRELQLSVLPCIASYNRSRKGYVLQISSWVTKQKAVKVAGLAEKISGMKSFTTSATIPSLGKRYRVFLGVFESKKAADDMCLKIEALR